MYNSNPILNIDRQIEDLQRLKTNFQNIPPTNIINVGNGIQTDFKALYLNENEKVEDLLVSCKTAVIDLFKKELVIKDVNGDLTRYEIVIPLDEKDLKIKELEERINEYEQRFNASVEIEKSTTNATINDEHKSKRSSKAILE